MPRSEKGGSPPNESALDTLLRNAADENIPLACLFEVTYRCDQECVHCYRAGISRLPELSTSGVVEVLEKLSRGGILFVTFTGGEPFARDDFPVLLEEASRIGFVLRVFSNGTGIDRKRAKMLAGNGVAGVDLSLYGAVAETHDRITRRAGSWNLTMNALAELTGAGIPVVINTTIMKQNTGEIIALADLASSRGAGFSPNAVYCPPAGGIAPGMECRAEDAAIAVLASELPLGPAPRNRELALSSHPCNAGRSSFSVDPSGRVFPCPIFPEPVGDLTVDELETFWKNSSFLTWMRGWTIADFKECAACPDLGSCNPCPALNRLENGDFFTPGGSICRLAKLLARCPAGS